MLSELEFLVNYIALRFEVGDEATALGIWLAAMDDALEEASYTEAQVLLHTIRMQQLSIHAQAEVELTRANWHQKYSESEATIAAYRRAIAAFRRLGDPQSEALASNSLALFLQTLGRYAQASIHYRVAVKLYRRLADHEALGGVWSNLGSLADDQRDWRRALPLYQRATKEFSRAGAKRQLASTYNNLGVAYEMLDDLENAEMWYLRCVDLLDEMGESFSEAGWRILTNLAQLYARRGSEDKVRNAYHWALEVAEVLDSNRLRALTWNNRGLWAGQSGDKPHAAHCLREALKFQGQTNDRFAQAMILNNLGATLSDLEAYSQAELCYRESLALSREFDDLSGEARTLNNLAVLQEAQKQLAEAMATYQRASDLFAHLNDVRRQITTLTNLASVSWRSGHEEPGRSAFLQAWLLACRETYENELATLYQLRGDWLAQVGGWWLAKRWYQHALRLHINDKVQAGIRLRLNFLQQQGH